jgi:hypothetical protein
MVQVIVKDISPASLVVTGALVQSANTGSARIAP